MNVFDRIVAIILIAASVVFYIASMSIAVKKDAEQAVLERNMIQGATSEVDVLLVRTYKEIKHLDNSCFKGSEAHACTLRLLCYIINNMEEVNNAGKRDINANQTLQ